MSRTAPGAVLVSCLVALFLGPELGFGPFTSTSPPVTRARPASGAWLVSCLVALFLGRELGFGPIPSTSRADTRRRPVPQASVLVVTPPFIPQSMPSPVAAHAPAAAARPASAPGGKDVWARLRACESPTNAGTRY